jgi:hypothetical protein
MLTLRPFSKVQSIKVKRWIPVIIIAAFALTGCGHNDVHTLDEQSKETSDAAKEAQLA